MRKLITLLAILVLTLTLESSFARGQRVTRTDSQSSPGKKMTSEISQESNQESKSDSEAPFACSLTALSAAEREHHKELSKVMHAAVKEIRELPNGYGFSFSGERRSILFLSEWISLERLCCPFFSFQLEVRSEGQPVWLRITGRDGVKGFMQSEFGIK